MYLVEKHGVTRERWKKRTLNNLCELFMWTKGTQTEYEKACYFDADGNINKFQKQPSSHVIKSPAGIFPFLLLLCSMGTQQRDLEPVRKSW